MGKRIKEGWGESIRRTLRLCAAAVAAVCLLGLLPAGRVQAEDVGKIKIQPISYDRSTNTATLRLSSGYPPKKAARNDDGKADKTISKCNTGRPYAACRYFCYG